LILLVIGFIANLAILETIGIISVVIGVVLWILGSWDARSVVLVARWRATRDRIGPVGGGVSA
jgi:hypothetical protein